MTVYVKVKRVFRPGPPPPLPPYSYLKGLTPRQLMLEQIIADRLTLAHGYYAGDDERQFFRRRIQQSKNWIRDHSVVKVRKRRAG